MSVRVHFLGTGAAQGDGGLSQACILVTGREGSLLLDCGATAMPAIRRTCDPETIDAIAVTHLHGDHFAGIVFFLMHAKWAPRKRPLLVAGPPSLERRLRDVATIMFDDFHRDLPFDLRFATLTSTPMRVGPATISALPVDHVPSAEPLGLRVSIDGRLIAYSGDALWSEKLPPVADGADLFICEATYFTTPDPVHLSAKQLVEHRDELRCKRIITTHLSRDSIANLAAFPFEYAKEGSVVEL